MRFKKILFLAALFLALPQLVMAQTLSLDLGAEGGSSTALIFRIIALTTVLSLAPSILMMVTSFTRIVIVLSFVRSAVGTQQSPPNIVLISLALFLTSFIMAPTFNEAFDKGITPLIRGEIGEMDAFNKTAEPFKRFMLANTREKDILLFIDLSGSKKPETPDKVELRTLIPAFMISEMRRAFEIGFLIFIPFLVIDMVVSSVLMAMGMMMLPPSIISLPFKLIFFVLVDGWYLIAGSLVKSYVSS